MSTVRRAAAVLALLVGCCAFGEGAQACDERILGSCKPAPVANSTANVGVESGNSSARRSETRSRRGRNARRAGARSRSARSRVRFESRRAKRASVRMGRRSASRRAQAADYDGSELVGRAPRDERDLAAVPMPPPVPRGAVAALAQPSRTWPLAVQPPATGVVLAADVQPWAIPTAPPPEERATAPPPPARAFQISAAAAAAPQAPSPPATAPQAEFMQGPAEASADGGDSATLRVLFLAVAGILALGTAVRLALG